MMTHLYTVGKVYSSAMICEIRCVRIVEIQVKRDDLTSGDLPVAYVVTPPDASNNAWVNATNYSTGTVEAILVHVVDMLAVLVYRGIRSVLKVNRVRLVISRIVV
jgi:hypothetical protein